MAPTSFGIMTAPMNVDHADVLRVWREADTVPEIEHAWLFDHLMPIGGDPDGPIYEGWTLLAALAGQTRRLRLGLLVTSNRIRPPALLAKIATTVDVVSGGRLDFGIGAGSRPSHPLARREYDSHGLPYADFGDSVEALAEACTVIRRLWTEDAPFDFRGTHVQLTGAYGNPKPVQRPHPPIVIGGRAAATLRVVAEHADVWNIPGGDIEDARSRSALLDRYCAAIGRDPRHDHPLDLPAGLVRRPRLDTQGGRGGHRGRLRPRRPGPGDALSGGRGALGGRRADRAVALIVRTKIRSAGPAPAARAAPGRPAPAGPAPRAPAGRGSA